MQITSGVVRYLRVVKDDDFGIKREANVELSFTIAEGADAVDVLAHIDRTKDLTVAKVHEMLRVKPATKSDAAPAATPAGTPLPAAPAAGAAKAPEAKPPVAPKKSSDKDKLAAAAADKATPKKPVPAIEERQISTGEERKSAEDDDMAELFGDDEPKAREVTDKEINEEVQKTVARLKSAEKVKALKEQYVGAMPKTVRDVPQEKRVQFLKDLKAL